MSRKGIRGHLGIAGLLIALALAGPIASASACAGARQKPPQLTAAQAKRAVICLINKRRAHFHAHKLRGNSQLTRAAEGHSTSMNDLNYFAHDSSSDGSPVSRISATGYMNRTSFWTVGEDLRWGWGTDSTPKSAVAAWMHSAEHRSVMLSPSFRDIGIGFAPGSPTGSDESGSGIYTADFGARR
jgi:uncharacterized protein YkwD